MRPAAQIDFIIGSSELAVAELLEAIDHRDPVHATSVAYLSHL
jgi:hypothetical protein